MADRLSDALAARTSRRGFLDRVSRAMLALTGGAVASAVIPPGEAEAHHFCGHTFTTGSCPHPVGLPRIDARGYPVRAKDGRPVDDPDGRPLPPAKRTKVCRRAGKLYGLRTQIDGAWYRCCGGHVRKLVDCCAHTKRRINGDAALTGYCYSGRKVFCVHYYQTKVPC